MKRVLNGVHVLMAIGLVVALAACGGSDGSLKRERDQAQASAAAAEKMAMDAAAAQAAAEKMAMDAAAAQAAAEKMAMDAAAAQAAAEKMAMDDAAAAQAVAEKMAADAAAALAAAEKMAMDAAAALAAAEKMAMDDAAAAQAAADAAVEAARIAADLLAQAEADNKKLAEELAGVPETIEELTAALKIAKEDLSDAKDAQAEADKMLEDAIRERKDAQAAVNEPDADLTEAIDNLKAARIAVSDAEAKAMDTAEATKAATEKVARLDMALMDTDTGPSRVERDIAAAAAKIKAARAVFKLLDSVATVAADALPDADPPTAAMIARRDTTTDLEVSHDGAAAMFSGTTTPATGEPNAGRTTTVFSHADENIAPSLHGWYSNTLSGPGGVAMVYSNIEAPDSKLFALEYNGAVADFGEAGATANAMWAKSNIPTSYKYVGGSTGGSIDGSFRDIPGTFTCAAPGTCPTSTGLTSFPERRRDGSIVGTEANDTNTPAVAGDTWTFKPDDKEATIDDPDKDYLSFGYWLSGTTGFGVWYDGSKAVANVAADITDIDDTVTYTGVAAGKYVTKSDVPNDAAAGYFTARAVLTADFTLEEQTVDRAGTIKGTISKFVDEGSSTPPLGTLVLTLMGDMVYADEMLTVVNDTGVTGASGGQSHGMLGGWEAEFFGEDAPTSIPTGVAGAFNATIEEQAVVVGGFAATK